jgi:hypothetical protein
LLWVRAGFVPSRAEVKKGPTRRLGIVTLLV